MIAAHTFSGGSGIVDARHLGWILLLALGLRLIWAWWIPVVPLSDGKAYDAFARTLVEHGTFGWNSHQPTAFWPPGTTFLHAVVYWLFGFNYFPVVAVNIGLSLALIVICARLAARFWGTRIATLTALTLALWPTLVMYPTILASELPFLVLTLLALDVWSNENVRPLRKGLGIGLLLGFAALVRPQALLLPLLYAFCVVANAGMTWAATRSQLRLLITVGIVMAIVIAPWTWRNYQLYGEPVLISTNGGITLWMGNTPGTDGRYMYIPKEFGELPENERARTMGRQAKAYIQQDPLGFVIRAVRKVVILYSNESVGVGWNAEGIKQALGEPWVPGLKRFTQLTWMLILGLALVGLGATVCQRGWRKTLTSPFVLSILYFTAIHSVVVSQERYHLAFAGQMAILAAVGAAWLSDRVTSRRRAH
ncbi:glycosyltransferase family 39 protein [Hydrogenophaga sp.]|uniref:glycosyltransferase family 39 protein n=1 Tax=Hydrogenophaga sp. TaxID=1904254 RepID=UPI003D11D932